MCLIMDELMTARYTHAYVHFLLIIATSFLALSLLLHVSVLLGAKEPYAEYGKVLFLATIVLGIPTGFLQKDRNVWRNELRRCPTWMRRTAVTMGVYGLVILCLQFVIVPEAAPLLGHRLTISALPVSFDAMYVCILYSVAWSGLVDEPELLRRTRNSVIALMIVIIALLADRAGYLHHPRK